MDIKEKVIARKFFKCKVLEANGQAFEDLFVRIMGLAFDGFKPIKPHGSIGDLKNDGYIEATGTYYQVFAPEDLRKSHANATAKLKNDLKGLLEHWPNVSEFYFVLNDKYKGPYPGAAQDIAALKALYDLKNIDFLLAKDLENIVFSKLPDDAIFELVGCPPDPSTLPHLDFTILGEVIGHLMDQPSRPCDYEKPIVPDWDEKIECNDLSETIRSFINAAAQKMGYLNEYLNHQGEFAAQELKNRMVTLYENAKKSTPLCVEKPDGDILFYKMQQNGVPKQKAPYHDAFMVVFAKYFETCDVFEDPKSKQC